MAIPLINGRAYSWADIIVAIGGVPLIGITSISYDEEQVKEDMYGSGIYPVERGYGNKKSTASIKLYAGEVEAITDRAPNGNLLDYGVFEIVVKFLVGTVIKTHVLNNVEFTKNMRSMNQGDTKIEVELPLIVSHITWKK